MNDRSEPVGSLTEEAARLAEALQGWVHEHGVGLGALDEQISVGSAECRLCPVCRAIARMREAGPEPYRHLADAASSLLLAVREFADPPRPSRREGAGKFEHIDIDAEEEGRWD